MNMIEVSSSNIASVGYEGTTLYVRFHNGGLYAYYDVPRNIFNNLLIASSRGKYFADYIKDCYRFQKIA